MPISLALIVFSSGTNLEKVPSSAFVSIVPLKALAFNIIPIWGWMGTLPKGWVDGEVYKLVLFDHDS